MRTVQGLSCSRHADFSQDTRILQLVWHSALEHRHSLAFALADDTVGPCHGTGTHALYERATITSTQVVLFGWTTSQGTVR